MDDGAEAPLKLRLGVVDPALGDRLAALLAAVPGLEIVPAGRDADAMVVSLDEIGSPTAGEPAFGADAVGEPAIAPAAAALDPPALTPRELEVLDVLAEGASNREIAERLGISVHTAKFHVGSIIEKLDSSGRTDAVAYALRAGVLAL